jgi:ABC-type glutathione transport system ATPase component
MSTDRPAKPAPAAARGARPEDSNGAHAVRAPLLDVREVTVEFRARSAWGAGKPLRAVDGVSLTIAPREVLGLVGESGSGKSTLGRAILRLVPAAGRVLFDGLDVLQAAPADLRRFRRRAQVIFQDPGGSLDPRMTVAAAIAEPLVTHRLARSASACRPQVLQLLDRCGMPRDSADRLPHELSGGQRQRVCIARAIALKPDLIVCDEPTSALDVSVQAQILNLLADLRRDEGLSYLFISHDFGVIRHLCDRIAVMRAGRIVETGPADTVFAAPIHPYTRSLLAAVGTPDPRHPPA